MRLSPMVDMRDALLGSSQARQVQVVIVTAACCLVGFIGSIMLFSYLFAAPWHPPAPYHPPYRPSCQGSGVNRVINGASNPSVGWAYMIVCNDGFSYTVNS